MSSVTLHSRHFSRSPSVAQMSMIFGFSLVLIISCRQVASTCLKRLPSVGSCRMMSSESKIGCKYIHAFWHFNHSSKVSDTRMSRAFHSSMSSSKGPLKVENIIACVVTMCSSRRTIASPSPFSTYVPVFLYFSDKSNCKGSQSAFILFSVFSKPYSLPARSPTSATSLAKLRRPRSSILCKVKPPSMPGPTWTFDLSEICSQCLCCMPSLRRPVTSGRFGLNSSSSVLICSAMPQMDFVSSFSFKVRIVLNSSRMPFVASFSQ
mmetsp:Transcript_22095/g.52450  ORF Transcript_22095/g.52450 Transcript_22095/m.52450 type:complete len:264 (+) Transcript_22095:8956-9747(+)